MAQIRAIFLALFGLNLLAVTLLTVHQVYVHEGNPPLFTSNLKTQSQKNPYQFNDPFIAYHLLEKLDVSSAVGDKAVIGSSYKSIGGGYISSPDYCAQQRAHFVNNPDMVFRDQVKFMTNYWKNHQLRTEVIPAIGVDLHPDFVPLPRNSGPNTKTSMKIKSDVDTNVFFNYQLFYFWRQVGKQFSCLAQASNHIPGHDWMHRKDYVADSLFNYAQYYKSKPSCFSYDQYFPKTFVLKDKAQCEEFFREFNSPAYLEMKKERNVVYFRKIGANAHEGSGVFPVINAEETKIKKLYNSGALCGKVKDNNLIQYNVHNPLLLENRKFGFRMFMLLASANPVMGYYHDGYARLSIDEYNPNSNATRTFVTNIGVNLKEALKDSAFAHMNESEIQEYTYWELDKFGDYLYKNGIVSDPDWVNSYLRPQFQRVMIHLVRMGQHKFQKLSSVFEIFGLDFVMDADLGLWFIEANSMPLITGFTKGSKVLFRTMLTDAFEIVMGLTRSRMKRVIEYINNLTEEVNAKGLFVPEMNLDSKRAEFKKVIQNRFEPEFAPKPTNTFKQIIDENQYGVKRYFNLIKAECL